MQEAFLHYVWRYQRMYRSNLVTTLGECLKIIAPGIPNTNAGPDFLQARIHIGTVEWSGSVEMHVSASDWERHFHGNDVSYQSVILHVVWHEDRPICRNDGTPMPTLVLSDKVSPVLVTRYMALMETHQTVACQNLISRVSSIVKFSMVEKVAIQRLESKAKYIKSLWKQNNHDWEESAYQIIMENFGLLLNKEPFAHLARVMPHKLLLKHRNRIMQIEALLFGQAGLLQEDIDDAYAKELRQEYLILSKKYDLIGSIMKPTVWKFMRTRPSNFPTLRIAQLSALLHTRHSLFADMIEAQTVDQLRKIFKVMPTDYWHTHYNFTKKSSLFSSCMGKKSIDIIIINAIAPLLVAYAKHNDDDTLIEKALYLLESIDAEKNNIITQWAKLDIRARSALDSQGLIELNNNFCSRKKCMSCAIGVDIFKNVS